MEYNFRAIEQKWQQYWKQTGAYKVSNDSTKPKYYVLDMFPYPSGAGLHVGHPLGYIASDIFARFKRLKGYNVLHPMGYDAFGLPAEQYAIEHGVHPAASTKKNIENFRSQLDKIGFSYDWSRSVNTSEPDYYKWTQWIFLQLFKSWYNRETNKAEPIETLIEIFEKQGSAGNHRPATVDRFTAKQWSHFTEKEQQDILMQYRLCYCGWGEVNWCAALGTVLANDEVVNGVSERGGYPVVKKKLRQWYLRITEYADRLLLGLDRVDFSDAMKDMQSNWIGKSYGAEIEFAIRSDKFATVEDPQERKLKVYTTRPDTIFGVDFMVVAPEHELIDLLTTDEQRAAVDEYLAYVKSRSERERMAEKKITGVFTGGYAINRFNNRQIPVWISEYVLGGYGTGAIMAVPCGDERDFKFAKHFDIPITNIIGDYFNGEEANPTKEAMLVNSEFLDGMLMKDAMKVVMDDLEGYGTGRRKVNYKMRDAAFSRQRYWGEPFPIIWRDGIACPLEESELPLELPYVEQYGPGPEGEGPLANIKEWSLIPNSGRTSPQPLSGGEGQERGYVTNTLDQWKSVSGYAKENRKNATEAEGILWEALRNRQLENYKFRRQHAIAGFIPDFVCLEAQLIIELDGDHHNSEDQTKYDAQRTEWLNEHNYRVLRFFNEEVINNLPQVLQKIKIALTFFPSPLERGAGGEVATRETNTMPGYAGSSWYFLRYMDPHNEEVFCSRAASDYWNQVDLYIGGTEHAVGHLLYSRMWTKVLYDLGYIGFDEPYKKLVNQGMITAVGYYFQVLSFLQSDNIECINYGNSQDLIDNRIKMDRYGNTFISDEDYSDALMRLPYIGKYLDTKNRISRNLFKKYRNEFCSLYPIPVEEDIIWVTTDNLETDYFTVNLVNEKMSKSKFNTVNPDDLVNKYGADTFRMYEMFLGPVEQSKPWDTKGIEGVHRFLKKLWRLFNDDQAPLSTGEGRGGEVWTKEQATPAELKALHKAIQKIESDTERFSFNTAVSAFMVCVNELTELKCHKREVLEPLLILLTPYAPHIAEELWKQLGNESSVLNASYPAPEERYLAESTREYPVSINGRMRTSVVLSADADQQQAEEVVMNNDVVRKWMEGKPVKKFIFVKNKMVNVVV